MRASVPSFNDQSFIVSEQGSRRQDNQRFRSLWGFEDLIVVLYFYTCDICNGFGNR